LTIGRYLPILSRCDAGPVPSSRLTSYGTLYKALTRLEREGYLASRWEDPLTAAAEARPRRKFYRLTLEGEGALSEARAADRDRLPDRPAAAAVR
jgi:PadR family transcriptional regulator, regulatory protein PadR